MSETDQPHPIPDLPPGHEGHGGQEGGVSWAEVLEQWGLVEADWLSEYGERLTVAWPRLTWREFRVLVAGLLAADTRLGRHFANTTQTDRPEEVSPDV